MKVTAGIALIVVLLALSALFLWAQSEQVVPQEAAALDALARWVPADAQVASFFDLKPAGEMGRHWEHVRQQLEANPTGRQVLEALSNQLRVETYGLREFILGPVVNWSDQGVGCVVARVSAEAAAQEALLHHFKSARWEQESFEARILYYGRNPDSWQQRERMAWTVHDGLLSMCFSYDPAHDKEALTQLRALVNLDQADSLAGLSAWRTLRDRLPENPLGLAFVNVADQPPPPDETSLIAGLGRQMTALVFAATPEENGMRIEIAGSFELQSDAPPEVQALLNLPAVDPTAWSGLPADTATALISHDASVLWPWLKEALSLSLSQRLNEAIGLDLEADLASAGGPLAGDFALAIMSPLPGQPVIAGLPAGQLLILAQDASESQMAEIQARMEGRGAVFGPGEVEGVALQTQAGTELSGYAVSYGFDSRLLLLGTSPDVIGQSIAARKGEGLITTPPFRSFLTAMPDGPSLVIYLNSGPLVNLIQTNVTEERYQETEEYVILEAFEAVGISLRFTPHELEGLIYLLIK